jgi:lipopolysaccharide transport system permease protein
VVQLGLYVSPVGFSSSVIPAKWRLVYSLNPMVGVIDSCRWALLAGKTQLYWPGLGVSTLLTIITFLLALRYFRRTERALADII